LSGGTPPKGGVPPPTQLATGEPPGKGNTPRHLGEPRVREPRTYDVRLWVTADPPGPALRDFHDEVRELAQRHPGIDVRWIAERHDTRRGRRRK